MGRTDAGSRRLADRRVSRRPVGPRRPVGQTRAGRRRAGQTERDPERLRERLLVGHQTASGDHPKPDDGLDRQDSGEARIER